MEKSDRSGDGKGESNGAVYFHCFVHLVFDTLALTCALCAVAINSVSAWGKRYERVN